MPRHPHAMHHVDGRGDLANQLAVRVVSAEQQTLSQPNQIRQRFGDPLGDLAGGVEGDVGLAIHAGQLTTRLAVAIRTDMRVR